ncbi:MOSC domain-containing protein [Actinokineospora iranica]|uniref:MOSC domain-containing protein YiiM n=1 Tax=Actinokineospora iranica TaxID=1271860 RepID=A0A1G6JAU7_9PSEU|nr:MOSC domain-containing protein [Actinokineospora iranica]SDC16022.1 MOSC domain-containing protein YiiM [Actinokineospora iranica]
MIEPPRVLSVNVGVPRPITAKTGVSAIDKRPVDDPVEVSAPAARGASGLLGDAICDAEHHGGPDQAVYAYAREDLDHWEAELGRTLTSGSFGENLTTRGLEVTGAVIGERWRIGDDLLLRVTVPRVPCRTFAVWLDRQGWVKTFTEAAAPGAYFKVLRPGAVRAGDPVEVVDRPAHGVTIGLAFRALTLEPDLLPRLLAADDLPEGIRAKAVRRLGAR